MRTNLSSIIKINQIPQRYYRPESELELAALTRFEKVYTKIIPNDTECAADLAQDIAEQIERNVREKGRCVIGFGAGGCAIMVYDELVKLYFADKLSFANVIAFNMSEIGLGVAEDEPHSTLSRLKTHLFNKVDIEPTNIHTFSNLATKENVHKLCKLYEQEIDEFGGLDIMVCELTKGGGILMNESSCTMTSGCRLVLLGDTIRARLAESYQMDTAPSTAVTLGISNILAARKVYCIALGEDSATAVFNTIERRINENTPSSYLQMHSNAKLAINLEAASKLTRINYPWKVTSCKWNAALIRKAIIWLSGITGKPILKLTDHDYNEHGLNELLAIYGSAYYVNIQVFNDLQHTITGWPGGKPNTDDSTRPERRLPYPKRVLAFGPQPDNVTVSMGGTIRKLVSQGHEVHVAFETSGDVTVSDDHIIRHMMLLNKVMERYGENNSKQQNIINGLSEFIQNKRPGQPDSADVRFLKGKIFVCEGIMSCMNLGVKQHNIHELQLPFYVDHPQGKGKVSEADVEIVRKLIERIRPHQIFFADDLNDPYGIHLPATDVIIAAIHELKDEFFMQDCRIWMYRGQWGSWEPDTVQMAVPMSPEEFRFKRDSILKHQTQIHDAPFRGSDDGLLSWQRSIARNSDTAKMYERLGLASYEAIESFVQYIP